MNDSRITVNVAFRLSGTMMCRKRVPSPPSKRAASLYSSGIDRIPAMKMTSAMPTPFQTSTKRDGKQRDVGIGEPSGSIDANHHLEVVLIRPRDRCIRTANVIPTATVLTSTGKKMIERISVLEADARRWQALRAAVRSTLRPLVTIA